MPYKDVERRRQCAREATARYRGRVPEKIKMLNDARSVDQYYNRQSYVMRTYGITNADYEVLVALQENRCAICGHSETKTFRGVIVRLAVDHDHATGAVRGLLCHKCNVGLGHFDDDLGRLMAAIEYLSAHAAVGVA